ncbi:class II aldolase/adducin N-terminal [Aspergillus desertorum]
MSSLGVHFGIINPSDMILVDEIGVAVRGNRTRPVNAAGFLIHAAIHKSRPDVNAACHFHSTYGKAWSAFAQPLEMLNQDVAMFYGKAQSVYREFGGVSVDEAAYLFLLMEKSCQVQLAADAAAASGREKVYIGDEAARFTFENTSEAVSLYAEFQVYLQIESAVSHDGYKAL